MCLRFVFLLIMRLATWLRLSRREETWKTASASRVSPGKTCRVKVPEGRSATIIWVPSAWTGRGRARRAEPGRHPPGPGLQEETRQLQAELARLRDLAGQQPAARPTRQPGRRPGRGA
jgi:hypothetical protein